jgi:hypothetical protein
MRLPKRIYYMPGMISLVLLFPISLLYLYNKGFFKSEKVIEVSWYSRKQIKIDSVTHPENFSGYKL